MKNDTSAPAVVRIADFALYLRIILRDFTKIRIAALLTRRERFGIIILPRKNIPKG